MKRLSFFLICALVFCGKSQDSSTEAGGATLSKTGAVTLNDPRLQPPEQKFRSLANPGEWDKQKGDHVPYVEATETGANLFRIRVSIPFGGEGSHYTENIILVNHKMKELNQQGFKRGNKTAEAVFELKRNPEDKYYVLAKCSMHDVWVAEIALPKVKKSAD